MGQKIILLLFSSGVLALSAAAKEITFCGEKIPVENAGVSKKLMDVIRAQIPYANLPGLRSDARRYFPMIEYILKKCNMPDDLKYVPVVESGFQNALSSAGAKGFWQLMPKTAAEWGLVMNGAVDERNDIYKSTIVALRELARTFMAIRRDHSVSSWVLTAAAYNYGIGRLYSKMKAEGNNYFAMQLNPETALYVYKLIAIKELFEFPELYIRNFQYNVFNPAAQRPDGKPAADAGGPADFRQMTLTAKVERTAGPDDAAIKATEKPTEKELKTQKPVVREARLVSAQIDGRYPDFKDGDSITIRLKDDLQTVNGFQRKGSLLTGKGWIIDDRVFVDLGFGTEDVILYDAASEQGVALAGVKNKTQVILRVQN